MSSTPSNGNGDGSGNGSMRIAIPTRDEKLTAHFGHCLEFMLFDVDRTERSIKRVTKEMPPAHEPGVLPAWLASQGANLVIAGGMGQHAQQLFEQHGVKVHIGVAEAPAMSVVKAFLDGRLETGSNLCDH